MNFRTLAVVLSAVFLLPLYFAGTYVHIAAGPPAKNLGEISSKKEWSREGRDLLGMWLVQNLQGAVVVSAPSSSQQINLKTPMDISFPDYLELDKTISIGVHNFNLKTEALEPFRVTGAPNLVECIRFGQQSLCSIEIFVALEPPDPGGKRNLLPTTLKNGNLALVEDSVLETVGGVRGG